MVKLAEYKIRQRGLRGFEVMLPRFFVEENNLKAGDILEVIQKEVNGKPCIVLVPKVN